MADLNPEQLLDTGSQVGINNAQLEVLREIQKQLQSLNKMMGEEVSATSERLTQEAGLLSNRARAASAPNGAPSRMPPGGSQQMPSGLWIAGRGPMQSAAEEAQRETTRNQPPGKVHPNASVSEAPTEEMPVQLPGQIHPNASLATPTEVPFRKRLKAAKAGPSGVLNRARTFLNQEQPTQLNTSQNQQESGEVSPDASIPPAQSGRGGPSPIVPGMTDQEVNQMAGESITIPRFGEWQLDDKLAMARDMAGRVAINHPESTMGQVAGVAAGALNYAHANAANMVAANRSYDALHAKGQSFMNFGTELGFDPNNPVAGPGTVFGERNPLDYLTSSAGQQAAGAMIDAQSLSRLHSGLTNEQAEQIYGAVAGQGYSNQTSGFLGATTGGNLQNISNNLVAPVVKATGANPEDIAQFATFLRTGTVNLGQLTDTLMSLGTSAQASNETLSTYTDSLYQFTETLQTQFGALGTNAEQMGQAYTASTGLDPSLLSTSMATPMYQGLALGQYGVMPGSLGSMNPGMAGQNQLQELQMLQRATAGMNKTQYKTVDGQRVATISGQAQQMGMIAQLSGLPAQDVQSLLGRSSKITNADDALSLLGSNSLPGTYDYQVSHGGANPSQSQVAQQTKTWSNAVTQAEKAGVSKTAIQNLESKDANDPGKMAQDLQTQLAKIANPTNTSQKNSVDVKFTGLAQKFFQQDLSKLGIQSQAQTAANAGGSLITDLAVAVPSPGQPIAAALKLLGSL